MKITTESDFFEWICCLFQEDWNLRNSGIMNLRRTGIMNLQNFRIMNLWRFGIMNLRRFGIMDMRRSEIMNLQNSGMKWNSNSEVMTSEDLHKKRFGDQQEAKSRTLLTDKRHIPLRSASVRTPLLFHHGIPKVLVNPRSKGITSVRSTTTH
jgi:hypothetical protein